MKRLLWVLPAAASCGSAARSAARLHNEAIHAPSPCVPALASPHLAITGSAGPYRAQILAIAVSPDRRTIVTARRDGILQIDDVAGGTTRCQPGVHAFALSEDARWAAGLELANPGDGWLDEPQRGLTLWDVQRGARTSHVEVETPEALAGAVSDQGVVAVTGFSDSDSHVLLWDHGEPRELPAIGWPARPSFAPDGRSLLSTSSVGAADLYRSPGWSEAVTTPTSSDDLNVGFPPTAVASGTHRFVVAGWRADHPVLELWEPGGATARFSWPAPADELPPLAGAMIERRVPTPGGEAILEQPSFSTVALSPGEDTVAAGFDLVSRVLRYDTRTGQSLAPLPLVDWPVALAYSADGRWLVVADFAGTTTIFDTARGVAVASSASKAPASSDVQAEDRSADGSRVLVGTYGRLALDDGAGKASWSVVTQRESADHRVRLSPSGRLAWSGGNYESVMVDATTGRERWRARADYGAYEAAFTPDEASIVVSTAGGIELRDAATGQLVRALDQSKDALHFALSPDGARVVGGYGEETLKVWDVATGRVLRDTSVAHGVYTMSVAYSPDGRWVATAEADTAVERWGSIRLWDGETGAPIDTLSLDPLEAEPRRIAFTGDQTLRVTLDSGSVLIARVRDQANAGSRPISGSNGPGTGR